MPDFSAALPNLVIAGVTKAGTTSLHHYLGQHPDIGVADLKEVDHYAPLVVGEEPPSLEEYARHFDACRDKTWRLDASPRYFIGGPALVNRLAGDLGRPRILIALRDPVARMWSSYTYKRGKDRLPAGMRFGAFFDACARVHADGSVRAPASSAFRTLASGVYADFLGDWFDVLGDDVRVLFFDDLAHPVEEVTRVCEWLGLDTAPVAQFDLATRNATFQPRSQALRSLAQGATRRLRRVVDDEARVTRLLRTSYQKLNTGRLDEQLSDADRERLRGFYAPTLPPLRQLLEEHGCTRMPTWLTGAAV